MKHILWLAVALLAGIYICGPIVDPDLWWHITVGRWILAHKEIPVVDHWNLFGVGKAWRAYSWSNEIAFAFFEAHWGMHGLLFLKLLLASALGISCAYCLSRISRDWGIGALLGAFVTISCFDHFTLRPQSLTWILAAWLIYTAEQTIRMGWSMRRAALFVLLMLVWSNTHLTASLGIIIVAGWLYKRSAHDVLFKALLACFLGTLCTPYLGGEWLTFFSKTTHPFQHASIAEFQPATIMQYSTAFVVIVLFALLLLLHKAPRSLGPVQFVLGGGFLLGSLAVVKFLPLAMIVLGSLLALVIAEYRTRSQSQEPFLVALEKLVQLGLRMPREGLVFVLLCLTFVNAYGVWQNPVNLDIVPQRAVDFILQHRLPHSILVGFGNGGYLMYRLSDSQGELKEKVVIDGRTNVVPHEVWNKFDRAFHGDRAWQEYLDLIHPKTILWKNESPLIAILLATSQWCEVYRDGAELSGYSVFVSRDEYAALSAVLPSSNCKG